METVGVPELSIPFKAADPVERMFEITLFEIVFVPALAEAIEISDELAPTASEILELAPRFPILFAVTFAKPAETLIPKKEVAAALPVTLIF